MKPYRLLAALVVASTAGTSHADLVNVACTADAELRQNSPTINVGSLATVVSGRIGNNLGAGQDVRRGAFRFDLANKIPTGATVLSVAATFQVTMQPSIPANSTFGLRRLLQNWSETEVTWSNRLSDAAWETPGATGAADSVGTPSSTVFVTGIGAYTFPSTSNLVADVQTWVDNPADNFGWLLGSEDEITLRTARHFGANESGTNTASLTVEYSIPTLQPVITEVGVTNQSILLKFTAQAGNSYAVESRDSLTSGLWSTLTNIAAQPSTADIIVSDPLTPGTRFYRVRTP